MNMITFAIEFRQFSLKLIENMNEYLGENFFPVFGNKYQMHMHIKCAVSANSDIRIFFHNTLTVSQANAKINV